jgi:hypothetical protein
MDPIEDERVEVNVEVQGVAEALHEGDGAALPTAHAPLAPRATAEADGAQGSAGIRSAWRPPSQFFLAL